MCLYFLIFFFKQKTAYEMRISDWSSDVCSSDLSGRDAEGLLTRSAWQKAYGRLYSGSASGTHPAKRRGLPEAAIYRMQDPLPDSGWKPCHHQRPGSFPPAWSQSHVPAGLRQAGRRFPASADDVGSLQSIGRAHV